MIYKIKRFSYSNTSLSGNHYINSQVIGDATNKYLLNPVDEALEYVEKTKVGKLEPVKKKTKKFRSIAKSIKTIISSKKKKNGE